MSLPTRILVPTDFSGHAECALIYAMELAEKVGASVFVLNTFETPILSVPDAPWFVTTDVVATIQDASKKALDDCLARHGGGTVKVETILKAGDVRTLIEETANEIGADLICMGTHGRQGLERALLGSVAEFVVRSAHIPVLTVHDTH